jgi:hypothetical protein
MFAAYVVITLLTAAVNLYGATADFTRPAWLMDNMTSLGLSEERLAPLGVIKAVGAAGLLVGFAVPLIGAAAAAGLVLYFILALGTVLRARCFDQIPYPTAFLLLAGASLALLLAA